VIGHAYQLVTLREETQRRIDAGGALEVTKRAGVFLA
jgi:hypothetical protein